MSDLRRIPGVGKDMEQHLLALGIGCIADLRDADPEELYRRDCALHGPTDRCVLYVYRLCAYYASRSVHDPEKLTWWYWKDSAAADRRRV